MNKVRAGIVGAAGYTGGELLRLLLRHPSAEVAWALSRSLAGQPVTAAHGDLTGETDLTFSETPGEADVVFLCLGHGESKKYLAAHPFSSGTRIIDLSQDFRLGETAVPDGTPFVYGLPELNREAIRTAAAVANPGCFATAIQLALLPLAGHGVLPAAYCTGITGSTGAGITPSATTHFSWRANNIQAYKSLSHQHLREISRSLQQLQPGPKAALHFVPWRGDFTRGIFVSCTLEGEGWTGAELTSMYQRFYEGHPFTHLSGAPLHLKMAVNTNKCLIDIEVQDGRAVIHAALDNLLKGASGQAVQNMNLMFGLEEAAGLQLKATYF